MSDDVDLLARLSVGDPAAIEQLMGAYGDRVYRLAYGVTRNEADAQEVVQDVFLTVCRKHATFEGRAALSTWIYRVTMNAALNKRRGKRAELETSLDAELPTYHADGHREGARPYLLADWSNTPEQELLSGESRAVLTRAIEGCGPCQAYLATYRRTRDVAAAAERDALAATHATRDEGPPPCVPARAARQGAGRELTVS